MSDHKRFMIISNTRCGSTFLATALGRLRDVHVDYEVKIPPLPYKLQRHHRLVGPNFYQTFWQELESQAFRDVYGTKCVLDPIPPTKSLSQDLAYIISPKLKYIFLRRSVIEQIISQYKSGMVHRSHKSQLTPTSSLEQAVRNSDDAGCIVQEDFIDVVKRYFIDEALSRIETDEMIKKTLVASGAPYFELEYKEISSAWAQIKDFIGSDDRASIEDCTVTEIVNTSKTTEEKELIELYRSFDTFRDDLLNSNGEAFGQFTRTSTDYRRASLKSLIILLLKKLYHAQPVRFLR